MRLLIITPSAHSVYQSLAKDYMAVEPPLWALLLAQSVRNLCDVQLYDMAAHPGDEGDIVSKIKDYDPDLILYSIYGTNPNSSSYYMHGAVETAEIIHSYYPNIPIFFSGNHCSAVPDDVLTKHGFLSGVFINEGVYSLRDLILNKGNPEGVRGIWYTCEGRIETNPPSEIVPHERMDVDLPGFAWDLIDFRDYRTSSWHVGFDRSKTSPFSSIYTSLGCIFQCEFCIINSIGRNNNDLRLAADSFNKFRYWSIEHTTKQLEYLAKQGVSALKFADEMWLLKPDHYAKLSQVLKERFSGVFNIWAYTRISTCKEKFLKDVKDAGVTHLGCGLESGSQVIREEITKGHFKDVDIEAVLKRIDDHGIGSGHNWIVGLGSDDFKSCNETLASALELSHLASNINVYPAMDLPGSPLFSRLRNSGKAVVKPYEEYSFLGYNCVPSGTPKMSPAEVLAFRDYFFDTCFTNPGFLNSIKNRFGQKAVDEIKEMTKIKLKRRLLND